MSNYGSNVVGGMGYGALAGGSAFGAPGVVVGGIAGALAGLFSSIADDNDAENRRTALRNLATQLGEDYDTIIGEYQNWYATHNPAGTIDDGVRAANEIRNFDYSKYDWMSDLDANRDGKVSRDEFEFDYDKTVDDFLNPYMDKIVADVSKQMRGTSGGALTGRSTDAQTAMTRAAVEKEDEIYKTALQEYNTDRDFAYKTWSDYNTAMQNRLKGLMEADQWQIGQMQQLGQDALNWQSQAFQAEQDARQNKINTQAQLNSAAAQI